MSSGRACNWQCYWAGVTSTPTSTITCAKDHGCLMACWLCWRPVGKGQQDHADWMSTPGRMPQALCYLTFSLLSNWMIIVPNDIFNKDQYSYQRSVADSELNILQLATPSYPKRASLYLHSCPGVKKQNKLIHSKSKSESLAGHMHIVMNKFVQIADLKTVEALTSDLKKQTCPNIENIISSIISWCSDYFKFSKTCWAYLTEQWCSFTILFSQSLESFRKGLFLLCFALSSLQYATCSKQYYKPISSTQLSTWTVLTHPPHYHSKPVVDLLPWIAWWILSNNLLKVSEDTRIGLSRNARAISREKLLLCIWFLPSLVFV